MMKKFSSNCFNTFIFAKAQAQSNKAVKDLVPEKDYTESVLTLDSTINSLYAVISGEKKQKRDWALFKFLFYPEAKLIASGKNDDGKPQVKYMKPEDYIKSSGKWLVENGFFENEIHRSVDNFGTLAHVFSTYETFHSKKDETPFMRGINSIQLFNDGKRWWIVNVYWSQESKRNPIPQEYLPHGQQVLYNGH
jgi:hypothetical protein